MKRVFILLIVFGIGTVQVSAQSKREKITELFGLMKTDQMFNSMLENMTNIQNSLSHPTNTRKDSLFRVYVKEETVAFLKKVLNKDMADIYDKYYTIEEIQKYLDFFKTPEAQKMIDLMPVIQKDYMSKMMTTDMPVLREKFKKKLEELGNQ